jgi:hypothetical protein
MQEADLKSCIEVRSSHCWHYASMQHTISNHRDEICCHCGQSVCRNLYGYDDSGENLGHGKYSPHGSWYA